MSVRWLTSPAGLWLFAWACLGICTQPALGQEAPSTEVLSDRQWEEFFPPMVKVVLANQLEDGSLDRESHSSDNKYGNSYTTSLMLLTLGAPNQLLPVLQR